MTDSSNKNDKLVTIKQLIEGAKENISTALHMLSQFTGSADFIQDKAAHMPHTEVAASSERILEGLFNGQHMIDAGGKVYTVPANYASKSKLVEGDRMKLTITPDGKFMYKQIAPVPRKRIVGTLIKDPLTKEFQASAEGNVYHILIASITYFKGEEGDEIVLLVPQDHPAKWAAVENIIHSKPPSFSQAPDASAATVVEEKKI